MAKIKHPELWPPKEYDLPGLDELRRLSHEIDDDPANPSGDTLPTRLGPLPTLPTLPPSPRVPSTPTD